MLLVTNALQRMSRLLKARNHIVQRPGFHLVLAPGGSEQKVVSAVFREL